MSDTAPTAAAPSDPPAPKPPPPPTDAADVAVFTAVQTAVATLRQTLRAAALPDDPETVLLATAHALMPVDPGSLTSPIVRMVFASCGGAPAATLGGIRERRAAMAKKASG